MSSCASIEDLLPPGCAEAVARFLGTVASGMALVLNGEGARGVRRVRDATYQLVREDTDDVFRLPLRVQAVLWLRDAGPDHDRPLGRCRSGVRRSRGHRSSQRGRL